MRRRKASREGLRLESKRVARFDDPSILNARLSERCAAGIVDREPGRGYLSRARGGRLLDAREPLVMWTKNWKPDA